MYFCRHAKLYFPFQVKFAFPSLYKKKISLHMVDKEK